MTSFKQPSEIKTFSYDFEEDLGEASIASIVAPTPVAIARDGGALITVDGAPAIGAKEVQVAWAGGVTGETYLTTVRVLDTNGDTHERDGEIIVLETTFSVPAGIPGRYLSADEYVLRYGAQETIRLTDETRTNTVDSAKLEQALKDASDFADAYIGTAYDVPLLVAPRIVKAIVGALARELLHKTRPTPEVTAAADRARTQLKDIAAGRMTLPVDSGDPAPTTSGQRDSASTGDRDDTFKEGVAGYTIGGYGGVAGNWRL